MMMIQLILSYLCAELNIQWPITDDDDYDYDDDDTKTIIVVTDQ
jgi:hypothetical protein